MVKKGFIIVGARPNFMKAAALYPKLSEFFDMRLVHTGQHYDERMSNIFFKDFDQLEIAYKFILKESGQVKQTAEIMIKFEKLCKIDRPDFVVVVGDVNSTLACALVAKKLNITVVHVEAGLRSFDMTMPEEINRIMVDSISDYLFTTEPVAQINCKHLIGKSFLVGDVMIDTLKKYEGMINIVPIKKEYCICTIHRQKNVNDFTILKKLLEYIAIIANSYKVIFPMHPNTKNLINKYRYGYLLSNIDVMDPMHYLDFLSYIKGAKFIVTDSGSLQTECNCMNTPCLVLRENTERYNAIQGCCELVGFDKNKLFNCIDKISNGNWKSNLLLSIDDGKAADRIATYLKNLEVGLYDY